MKKCPICGNENIVPQGDGYVCNNCGYEIDQVEFEGTELSMPNDIKSLVNLGIECLIKKDFLKAYDIFYSAYTKDQESIEALFGMIGAYEGVIRLPPDNNRDLSKEADFCRPYYQRLGEIYRGHKFSQTEETKQIVNYVASDSNYTVFMEIASNNPCFMIDNDVIRLAIECGADLNHRNKFGETPLGNVHRMYANAFEEYPGTKERISIMVSYGANPNLNYAIQRQTSDGAQSGGCYVATAVYGSYDCPQVWTLRRYRDYTLAESWYGRLFIRTYYAVSPTLVKWFGNTSWFKNMWKPKLDHMVANLQSEGVESTPYKDRDWQN